MIYILDQSEERISELNVPLKWISKRLNAPLHHNNISEAGQHNKQ